jgi:hypothetical protein
MSKYINIEAFVALGTRAKTPNRIRGSLLSTRSPDLTHAQNETW